MIRFEVNTKPRGKERARHGKHSTYSTKAMVAYETEIKLMARQAMVKARLQISKNSLHVIIHAYFNPAKSWTVSKKDLAYTGGLGHTSKPDADNISKAVLDAMNGIVYNDDSQVVSLTVTKEFVGYGGNDKIVIMVSETNLVPSSIKTQKDYDDWITKKEI